MTTQPDPFLEAFAGAKGQTADPNVFATQIGNLLNIVSGRPVASAAQEFMPSADTSTATSTDTPTGPDGFDNPVEGGNAPINSGFGPRGEGFHYGADIGVPSGTHMIAAISGTVTHAAGDDPGGYGNWVEITGANGLSVRYGHLSSIGVQQGQTVSAGQSIGSSGGGPNDPGKGNAQGAHLHFEVRQNGQPVDPAAFLAGGAAIVGAAPASGSSTTEPTPLTPEQILAAQVQNTVDVLSGKEPSADSQQTTASKQTAGKAEATGNWAADILKGMGAPATEENLSLMETWMAHEGGAIHNNPLNTTQEAPGATDWNSIGVKTYTSYEQGLQATIQTLFNGRYQSIIDAFRSGNTAAARQAIVASPWGTKNL